MTYREIKAPLKGGTIVIGKVNEKDAERIAFDITGYEDCTVTVKHQRATDTEPYAANDVTIDGSTLYWIPNKSDTSIKGFGKLELVFTNGDSVAKSITYETCVKGSLGTATEEPDPHETWADKILNAANTVIEAFKTKYLKSAVKSADGSTLSITDQDGNVIEFQGGSSTITVDDTLSTESTNPVQNAVITAKLNTKANSSSLAAKQDKIEDLDTIRSGAAAGTTALQSVPDTYRTAAAQDEIDETFATKSELYDCETAISAKANASDVYTKTETDTALELKADKTSLAATDRSLEMLWKLNKGQTYDIEEQTESGTNSAPSGAKYETVEEVYGNSTQDSTNGYQLINFYGKWKNATGASVTHNDDYSNIVVYGTSGKTFETAQIPLNDAVIGNTVYGIVNEDDTDVTQQYKYTQSDGTDKYISFSINQWVSMTFPSDCTKPYIVLRLNGSTALTEDTDVTFTNCMVSLTNGADWEPYTGGMASPNPDYPQEITDVTQENIKVVGKNIITTDTESGTIDSATGAEATGKNQMRTGYMPVIGGATYYFSTTSDLNVKARYYDADKAYIGYSPAFGTIVGEKVMPTNARYIRLTVDSSSLTWFADNQIQLEKGSSATDYEAYSETDRTMNYTLRSAGTVHDVLTGEGITRNVGAITFPSVSKVTYDETTGRVDFNADVGLMFKYPQSAGLAEKVKVLSSGSVSMAQTNAVIYRPSQTDTTGHFYIWADGVTSLETYNANLLGSKFMSLLAEPATEAISAEDAAFLESLENLTADHTITITDQNGNDISYLVEYITKLDEVTT